MSTASIWGYRNWEGIQHFIVLASLFYHFIPEYLLTNAFLHLGLLIALFVGGVVEGIRLP